MKMVSLKYPVILADDIQSKILDELFSESTEKYLDNTVFKSEEERWAFRSGMNYAGILAATKCYKFGSVMVNEADIDEYMSQE